VAFIELWQKDSDWKIVEGGAWSKMKYNLSGSEFEFVFNGHGLAPDENYTLIYYPDPWPGTGLICLGSGTANEDGNVHLQGSENTGDLPASYDHNHPDNAGENPSGAKVWLVLSDDVDCENQKMVGWNPTEYLFEYDLITYEDTD